MNLGQRLAFNLALLVAIASPGPALLMAIRNTLSGGRRAGIAVGVGLGLMAATWTLMALLGLGIVFELFPAVYVVARIVGAAYLLYLAYRIWRDASAPVEALGEPERRAFRQGFLINLLNPKSVIFAAVVLVAVFPAGIGPAASLVIVVNHFQVEVAFYAALPLCLQHPSGCQALHAGQGVHRSLRGVGSRSARTPVTLEPSGRTVSRFLPLLPPGGLPRPARPMDLTNGARRSLSCPDARGLHEALEARGAGAAHGPTSMALSSLSSCCGAPATHLLHVRVPGFHGARVRTRAEGAREGAPRLAVRTAPCGLAD